jgi:histidine triad (HIT) family protein
MRSGPLKLLQLTVAKLASLLHFEALMAAQNDHTHCTFCDLIRGAAEVSICYEDADAIAFMDIQPVNNGHVLVVPRAHYESLLEVPQDLGVHLFKVTMRLANAVRGVTGCSDFNIVVNSGAAAGQDEPHYHVHIIPRRDGDGFDIPLPFNGSEMPDRTLLDAYAARIGGALSDPIKGGGNHGSGGASGDAKRNTADAPVSTSLKPDRRASTLDDVHEGGLRAGSTADDQSFDYETSDDERAVAVPTFDESESMSASRSHALVAGKASNVSVHEGAHGELTVDSVDDASDAA